MEGLRCCDTREIRCDDVLEGEVWRGCIADLIVLPRELRELRRIDVKILYGRMVVVLNCRAGGENRGRRMTGVCVVVVAGYYLGFVTSFGE